MLKMKKREIKLLQKQDEKARKSVEKGNEKDESQEMSLE